MAPETVRRLSGVATVVLASMRPGQDGPGNRLTRRPSTPTCRRFNEAGARWPRKHLDEDPDADPDTVLQ